MVRIPETGSYTLRQWRNFYELTQQEAAAKIGIDTGTLSNYERGKSFPDVPNIRKIEQAYNIPYSRIIFLPDNYD